MGVVLLLLMAALLVLSVALIVAGARLYRTAHIAQQREGYLAAKLIGIPTACAILALVAVVLVVTDMTG